MREQNLGLRERKKRLTRATIADAALRLSLEQGLEHVTIEEIAELAFISPRTFSNYFSCKEEAVVASNGQDWEAIVEHLAERPLSEPPLEALSRVVVEYMGSRSRDQQQLVVEQMRLVDQHESLMPFQMAQYARLEDSLMETVAQRTGTDPEQNMYPRLVAAGAVSAIKAALGLWARAGYPAGELPGLVAAGFEQLASGLPRTHSDRPQGNASAS